MIRLATKFDVPQIIEMLWHYHDSGKIKNMSVKDDSTALKILRFILVGGGIALVSEKNGKLTGMLLAVKNHYLWDDSKFVMNEIAYWVEEEHRGGTSGYRLLHEYVTMCHKLKDEGKICNFTMSQMEGQNLDYSKFGFEPAHNTWRI